MSNTPPVATIHPCEAKAAALQACLVNPRQIESTSDVLLAAMGLTEDDESDLTNDQRRYVIRATAAILEALSASGKVRGIRLLGGIHDFKPGANNDVGEHWSFSPYRCLGDYPESENGLTLIEAYIPVASINWDGTLYVLIGSAGQDWYEREIYVKPGAEVEVVRTWTGDQESITRVQQDLGDWFDSEEFLEGWVKANPYRWVLAEEAKLARNGNPLSAPPLHSTQVGCSHSTPSL